MTQTPLRRTPSLLRGIGALVVLLGVVIGVPVLLTTLMQILDMTPHGLPSIHDIATTLNKRDNGQLVAGVLLIAAWICWALFTLSLLPEIAAAVRHRPAVHLRGLSGFQRPAGALVAAVAIGFTLAPLVSATAARAATTPPPLPKASATATSATLAPSTIVGQPATSSATAAPAIAPTSHAPTANSSAPTYLVQRRDTLWGIAERYLQNPLRYGEIAALNPGVVGPDNEIHPGAVLTLPADATGLPSTDTSAGSAHMDVVVQPGDTLSGIVTDVAGDRAGWEQAWQANAGRAEPDGATFTDPDLIKPGWTLSIPTSQTDPANGTGKAGPTPTNPGPPTRPAPPPRSVPTTPISPTSTPGPSTTAPAPPTTPAPVGDASDHSGTHSSEVRVLAFAGGGGLLLAGVSLTALMRYRRRQFRRRRPGRTIGGSPESLIHLERAVLATGRAGAADVTWLDQALRSLVQASAAESAGRLPDVVAVCVAAEELTLVLAGPAPAAPAPWCVDATGCRWSIHRADQLPYDRRGVATTSRPIRCWHRSATRSAANTGCWTWSGSPLCR